MTKYKCLKCGYIDIRQGEQEVAICSRCNGASIDLLKMAKCLDYNKPLLSIELQDETSVPKVFYKGEEVKLKTNVQFDWDTDTEYMGGLTYAIEHYEHGMVPPVINRIERRVKGHAMDY